MASRTDRGVHARGNALALSAALRAPELLRALNGVAPDLYFSHVRAVAEDFRPRRALGRTYRYYEPARGATPERWTEVLSRFVGRVDVRSFGRGIPSSSPVWRDVTSASASLSGDHLILEIRAPSFVWGMVRKIVASARSVVEGRLSERRLEEAIAGRTRLPIGLAEPERLVLWEVEYDPPWAGAAATPTVHQRRWLRDAAEGAAIRGAILAELARSRPGSSETRDRGL